MMEGIAETNNDDNNIRPKSLRDFLSYLNLLYIITMMIMRRWIEYRIPNSINNWLYLVLLWLRQVHTNNTIV